MVPVTANFPAQILSKRKSVFFLFVFSILITLASFGQFQPTPVKRSNNQITISGRNYYLHEVLKGQTLYGISKEYKVSEEEIKNLNPDLNSKSAYPGMVLRIPDTGINPSPASATREVKFIIHKVQPKETFYSVSRKYGIKVDQIRELNPELKWGLKAGEDIKIPVNEITLAQEPVADHKDDKTVIIDRSDAEINETVHQPCSVKVFPHVSENFHIAVLLPLNLNRNDTLTFSDTLKGEYFRFYDFLEGAYMAIDSMKQDGINLSVEVFDTERSEGNIRRILNLESLRQADLIIGPVFPNEIGIVSEFAKGRHIPMVSPLSTFDVVTNNPYGFQVRNKLPRQIELATAYLGSKYRQNLVVIGRFAEKGNPEFERFRESLGKQLIDQDPAHSAKYKTIYFSESSRSFVNYESQPIRLDSYLSATLPNFFVLESENEVFITEVVNQLNQKATAGNIHVFGMNQWVFEKLDPGEKYNINLELYSDFEQEPFVDYNDPLVLNFCRKYKDNWNIEPSRYSFQGFDITYYFTRALFLFGRNLTLSVPCWPDYLNHPTMLAPLKFESTGNTNGFENQGISVIRYKRDELIRKKTD